MPRNKQEAGFSVAEAIIATVLIAILFVSIANGFIGISKSYTLSRQLNEVYAVLSSCPEVDRALQYNSISGNINCFPNNIFQGEGVTKSTIVYTPNLEVREATTLPTTDPFYNIPDSKVIDIDVTSPQTKHLDWNIRLLVTKNGIGQQ